MQDRTGRLTDFDRTRSITGKQGRLDIGDMAVRDGDFDLDVPKTGCDVLAGVLPTSQGSRNLERGGPKTATSRQEYGRQNRRCGACDGASFPRAGSRVQP